MIDELIKYFVLMKRKGVVWKVEENKKQVDELSCYLHRYTENVSILKYNTQ